MLYTATDQITVCQRRIRVIGSSRYGRSCCHGRFRPVYRNGHCALRCLINRILRCEYPRSCRRSGNGYFVRVLCEKALELVTQVKENTIPTCYSTLINRCVHFIHVNLHSRLKIETIAENLHVSRDYLSKAFKKATGISLHQYILDQKLTEAKKMLAAGMSVNEVSYTLCFCNESHFIQLFKGKYHMTPTEYITFSLN